MIFKLFYSYITNPVKTIKFNINKKPVYESIIAITLVSLAQLTQIGIRGVKYSLIMALIIFIISVVFLFFQSIVIDFIAQIFKYQAQSLKLFSWLCLTWLPWLLLPPALLIYDSLGDIFIIIPKTIIFIAYVATAALQIITIRNIYKTNTLKSLLIYLIPLLIIIFAIGLTVFTALLLAASSY
ncbi:MAG: hypothetical protein GY730_04275 [bacterium]|nr:hypothetical protein [bacterium]